MLAYRGVYDTPCDRAAWARDWIDKQGVPPEQIVCAARFKREWKDPMERWQGCTLTMDGEVVFNEKNFLKDRAIVYDTVKAPIAGKLKACHQPPKPV